MTSQPLSDSPFDGCIPNAADDTSSREAKLVGASFAALVLGMPDTPSDFGNDFAFEFDAVPSPTLLGHSSWCSTRTLRFANDCKHAHLQTQHKESKMQWYKPAHTKGSLGIDIEPDVNFGIEFDVDFGATRSRRR